MNTAKIVMLHPAAATERARAGSPRRRGEGPARHLHAAARRAWLDIVEARPDGAPADAARIERAAVLLARFREEGLTPGLQRELVIELDALGLPAGARARLLD